MTERIPITLRMPIDIIDSIDQLAFAARASDSRKRVVSRSAIIFELLRAELRRAVGNDNDMARNCKARNDDEPPAI